MDISFSCADCGQQRVVDESGAGRRSVLTATGKRDKNRHGKNNRVPYGVPHFAPNSPPAYNVKKKNSVNPKTWLFGVGLSLMLAGQTLRAQERDADIIRFQEFRTGAERGDANAEAELGACYDKGQGVRKDEAEAVKWFRKAAEQNLAVAQYNLGVAYASGQGVATDQVEAVKWFRKAAEQNLAAAQYNLGYGYDTGQGVRKDEVEAVKWFRKAAAQNLAAAQYTLGDCYDKGRGVTKNEPEAVKWIALAVAQGMKEAQAAIPLIQKKVPEKQIEDGLWRAIDWLENWKRVTVTTPQQ